MPVVTAITTMAAGAVNPLQVADDTNCARGTESEVLLLARIDYQIAEAQ